MRLRARVIWSSGAGGAGSASMGLALTQPEPTLKRAYAEFVEIYEELELAEGIHRRLGCPVLDITELSIEETAARIVRLVTQRRAHVAS